MTLEEAIELFDRVVPLDSVTDGVQVGVPYCCECPVIQNTQGGANRIYCPMCGREIQQAGQKWIVSNWGRRGLDPDVAERLRAGTEKVMETGRRQP